MNDSSTPHATGLTAFFDCRIGAAYAFAHAVWLPDAVRTLEELAGAIRASRERDVLVLCDRLRESARSVGASAFMSGAAQVEQRFLSGKADDAAQLVRIALEELTRVGVWLERRSRQRHRRR